MSGEGDDGEGELLLMSLHDVQRLTLFQMIFSKLECLLIEGEADGLLFPTRATSHPNPPGLSSPCKSTSLK